MAHYEDGLLVDEWSTLIDPDDYFDDFNVNIHGIPPEAVAGQPTFPEIVPALRARFCDKVLVCHTHFDRSAIFRAFWKHSLEPISCKWLDSAMVTRRAWPERFGKSGYGLKNVCDQLGYEFQHHDALEDAKASAFVLLGALRESGLSIEEWLRRVNQPVWTRANPKAAQDKLTGDIVVFTGTLGITRAQAASIAEQSGIKVADGVTKRTTILVVGNQDIRVLAGHDKSGKHRRAEELIREGQSIRILSENSFFALIGESSLTQRAGA